MMTACLLATVSPGANAKRLNGSTTDGLLTHVKHKYGTGGTDRHVHRAANRLKVSQDRGSPTEGAAAERLLAAAAQRMNTSAMLNSPFKSRALGPSEASEFSIRVRATFTVRLRHSPEAAGLCKCQFSRRWDGSY